MNALLATAADIQQLIQGTAGKFCFIDGLALQGASPSASL